MIGPARLGKVFVALADTLGDDFDVLEYLATLCADVVELLGADAAGVLLTDGDEGLRVAASSNETARFLELFEVQHRDGPCVHCLEQGTALINHPLDAHSAWPEFAVLAVESGYSSMHALPMRHGDEVLGALNVFAVGSDQVGTDRASLGQSLADAATIGLLQVRSRRDVELVNGQLEEALRSRVVIEQAKGMLSARRGESLEQVFEIMRHHARSSGIRLADVAKGVVEGRIELGAISPDAPRSS